MAGTQYRGSEIKDVDQFVNTLQNSFEELCYRISEKSHLLKSQQLKQDYWDKTGNHQEKDKVVKKRPFLSKFWSILGNSMVNDNYAL